MQFPAWGVYVFSLRVQFTAGQSILFTAGQSILFALVNLYYLQYSVKQWLYLGRIVRFPPIAANWLYVFCGLFWFNKPTISFDVLAFYKCR